MKNKFGGERKVLSAYKPIAESAKNSKIRFSFEKLIRTPNNLNAHRLISWVILERLQSVIVSRLFKAYIQEGVDIGQ